MPRSPNPRWFALRFEILERDEYTCRYCGRSAPSVPIEVDHVVAVAEGGTDDPENLVACCWSCNRGKEGLRARRMGRVGSVKQAVRTLRRMIPCVECGLPSDTLHLVPWAVIEWEKKDGRWVYPHIETGCKTHDPGGYWMPLAELKTKPLHWLRHLGGKNGRPDRIVAMWLAEWQLAQNEWTLRCAQCEHDVPWPRTFLCVKCEEDLCESCFRNHETICSGDCAEPPSEEVNIITIGELLAKNYPPSVAAMWNGKRYL